MDRQVCAKDNVYYDPWSDSTKAGADLTRSFYFYNITNPYDVLNGDTFKVNMRSSGISQWFLLQCHALTECLLVHAAD